MLNEEERKEWYKRLEGKDLNSLVEDLKEIDYFNRTVEDCKADINYAIEFLERYIKENKL